MILLETNVMSEVMKARPSAAVVAWLNGQESDKLYISAITIGEIVDGLRILPDGQRRSDRPRGDSAQKILHKQLP